MNEKLKKGLKPIVLKYMALLMGICYLANPVHNQIENVMHEISHVLQSPQNIVSHAIQGEHIHGHGFHQHGEHRLTKTEHQHKILDLIGTVFDASDSDNSENETPMTVTKCDKHISSQLVILPRIFSIITSHECFITILKVEKGFLNFPKEPPQLLSA